MNLGKLRSYLNRFTLQQAAVTLHDRLRPGKQEEVSYGEWLDHNRISSRGYAKIAGEEFAYHPVFGVAAHARGADRAAFVQSLSLQTYRSYRPLKEYPEADYTLLAGPGCTLTPDMLSCCVKLLNGSDGRRADLVYFDSDCIGSDGRKVSPSFRPEYDPDLLGRFNYMGNVVLVRTDKGRAVFEEMAREKGKRSVLEEDSFHEFLKRICDQTEVAVGEEKTGRIRHIPRVLYHEVSEETGRISLEHHVPRIKEDRELVSVIIPNKDHVEDLRTCINSLLHTNAYGNLEVLIIENNSATREIFDYYEQVQEADERVRVLTYTGPFNYSKINNYGAREARGTYLLFLNNDTAVLKPSSIWYLVAHASRKEVGAVGALLIYPDHTIQHAGVILGYGGIAGHAFQGEQPGEMPDPYTELLFEHTRNVSAVTGACMMVRKKVFDQLGGFDEKLAVTFNDVDLCLRLRRAGLRVLMCPDAELIHNESASRGPEDSEDKVRRFHSEIGRFMTRWEKELEAGDPFYNPNLTLMGRTYTCKDPVREARPPYQKYLSYKDRAE